MDAIALASTRFRDYGVNVLWNAANAAYSGLALARFISDNPYMSIGSALNQQSAPAYRSGIVYSQQDLVSLFPSLVGEPWNVRATMISEGSATGTFKTVNTPISGNLSWQQIQDRITRLLDLAGTDETVSQKSFYIGWVLGVPILMSE